MNLQANFARVLAVVCFLALGACGGGGGGSSSSGSSGSGSSGSGGGGGGGTGGSRSSDANLSALTMAGAALEQVFSPTATAYTAVAGFLIRSIEIDATAEDGAATVTVNGAPVASAPVTVDLGEGDNDIVVEVTAENGTKRDYTVTVTRQSAAAFAEDAYVKASNTQADDLFGFAVALDGDTLAVGAFEEDSSAQDVGGDETDDSVAGAGAVYVFVRDAAGAWSQQAYVKASNPGTEDHFGYALALSGDTLAVGAFGEDSAATGIDGDSADDNAFDSGAVYVFVRDAAGQWSRQAYVKASNTGNLDEFGFSVALSGDTLAVGAVGEASGAAGVDADQSDDNASFAGAVYMFTRDAGHWSQQAYAKASNAAANDDFGQSVALDGDTLVVGAMGEDGGSSGVGGDETDDSQPNSGAAYVFVRDAGAWSQQAYVKASNPGNGDAFGFSVDVSADTLVVGAPYEDSITTGIDTTPHDTAAEAGAAYVFVRDADMWSQQAYVKASNTDAGDQFGYSVALDGDALVVGALAENGGGTGIGADEQDDTASAAGATYLFTREADQWSQRGYLKASNAEAGDLFGTAVALSGDTLAVGAYLEDGAAKGVGGDAADNSAVDAGAVYLFGGIPTRTSTLSSLGIDGAGLDQIFQPTQLDYTAAVGFFGASVHIDAPAADAAATVRVNGVSVGPSGITVPLVEGNNPIEILVTAEDGATQSAYELTVTRESIGDFAQDAYLKAGNIDSIKDDQLFGYSVALAADGSTLAVGVFKDGSGAAGIDGDSSDQSALNSGAVYVFVRAGGGSWTPQAYIKASNPGANDHFGASLALAADGGTLAVGAEDEDSGATGVDGDQLDDSALDSGAVYVFARSGATWSQQAYLKASNTGAGDGFGHAIALAADGDTLAVGAGEEDGNAAGVDDGLADDSGAVYVFARNGATWSQQGYVKPSNTGQGDQFGLAVALSGDGGTLVATAPLEDGAGTGIDAPDGDNALTTDSGAAYVFTRDGGGWSQQAYVKASNTAKSDQFGLAVALSGDGGTLAVGTTFEGSSATGIDGDELDNSAPSSGAVYVFVRSGATWAQQAYVKASNTGSGDQFGGAVALARDGDVLAVGAHWESSGATGINGDELDDSLSKSGAAYLFVRAGDVWSQQAYVKASSPGENDEFGYSIALSGDTLAVGAQWEQSGSAVDETDDSVDGAGAVYVFH